MREDREKYRHNIRFTEGQHQQLTQDAEAYGMRIPDLIKAVYFEKRPARPAMHREDAQRVFAALTRIGNNINQIARQLNAGFRQGFNPTIEEMREAILAMKHFVIGSHGHSQA